MRYLDSNVLIRFFVDDPPEHGRRSGELLVEIEQGTEQVVTTLLVVFETVWVLDRRYKVPMTRIRDLVLPVIQLPSIRLADKPLYPRAFEIAIAHNIPFADAFSAAFMETHGIDEVYAWDRHFDRVEGITRIEPGK
jgi:uncharacterized protein